MTTVTGLTADRMLEIEAASIVDGEVNEDGQLILKQHDGTEINAGSVIGPEGPPGTNNPFEGGPDVASASTLNLTKYFHGITGTTTVANISKTVTAGDTVMLWIKDGPITFQNNGGGTGNIRNAGGIDLECGPNRIVVFIYDGTYWRSTKATSFLNTKGLSYSPGGSGPKMAGFAQYITPATKRLFVSWSGSCGAAGTTYDDPTSQIAAYYGTGTAPAAGDAPTGTLIVSHTPQRTIKSIFNIADAIVNLTPGTQIWLDLALGAYQQVAEVSLVAHDIHLS